jgi:hypothetical protein
VEQSGAHTGKTTVAINERTVVFQPSEPFSGSEAVDVALVPLWSGSQTGPAKSIKYRFYILRPAAAPLPADSTPNLKILAVASQTSPRVLLAAEPVPGRSTIMSNGVSVPSDFPHVSITPCRNRLRVGFGSSEVRTYRSLMRHWLASRIAMYFLANETQRLRGKKSADHAGAGGRCNEHAGLEYLETLAPLVDLVEAAL